MIFTLKGFRPLPGDLISQFKVMEVVQYLKKHVSVPFPGILFLNLRELGYTDKDLKRFPSPSRGSYFSIDSKTNCSCKFIHEFPSPSRGSYFSI